MERIVFTEINEKKYALCCSLGAIEEIQAKYKTVKDFIELITGDKSDEVNFSAFTDALIIFSKYGAKRAKKFCDEDYDTIESEDLEALMLEDFVQLRTDVYKTIAASQKHEVVGKSTSKKKEPSEE